MSTKTTPGQRVAELLRELSMKRKYYQQWERNYRLNLPGQKIKPEDAAHRIACFEDVIEDLYQLYPGLRPASTGTLFPGNDGRVYPPSI